MAGYTKLWGNIIFSSIWDADKDTRIVWITMLAMSDSDGNVMATDSSIAMMSRIEKEEFEAAISVLMAPDPASTTTKDDGRRLEKIGGGYRIINYRKYRERMSNNPETIRARERKRKQRTKDANPTND